MKKRLNISISLLQIMGAFLVFFNSCWINDDNDPSINNPNNEQPPILFNSKVSYGIMTDQDSTIYKTVTIGTQTWMAENLRTTKYNDGTAIPNVTDSYQWGVLTTGAYCNHYNTIDSNKIATYGRLYNWHAVNTGKLAPVGWHVPTDAEWTILTNYLGGESESGGKLKETGATHWAGNNPLSPLALTVGTNESGFTALPGSNRASFGAFGYIGEYSYWWSTLENDTASAWCRAMNVYDNHVSRFDASKKGGFSVRCLRD